MMSGSLLGSGNVVDHVNGWQGREKIGETIGGGLVQGELDVLVGQARGVPG